MMYYNFPCFRQVLGFWFPLIDCSVFLISYQKQHWWVYFYRWRSLVMSTRPYQCFVYPSSFDSISLSIPYRIGSLYLGYWAKSSGQTMALYLLQSFLSILHQMRQGTILIMVFQSLSSQKAYPNFACCLDPISYLHCQVLSPMEMASAVTTCHFKFFN